jgi:AraC-like DNA-binding protein
MPEFRIPTDKEIAEKARDLIFSDLSSHYSLPSLAGEAGTTPYSLKRIFKKQFGISLAAYSRQVRMEKAKELLATTNNTLQMIAEAVGYTEGNNFQQTFKREVGVTPGEWRRRRNVW